MTVLERIVTYKTWPIEFYSLPPKKRELLKRVLKLGSLINRDSFGDYWIVELPYMTAKYSISKEDGKRLLSEGNRIMWLRNQNAKG